MLDWPAFETFPIGIFLFVFLSRKNSKTSSSGRIESDFFQGTDSENMVLAVLSF